MNVSIWKYRQILISLIALKVVVMYSCANDINKHVQNFTRNESICKSPIPIKTFRYVEQLYSNMLRQL